MTERLRNHEIQARKEFGSHLVRKIGGRTLEQVQYYDIGLEIKPDGSKVTRIDIENNNEIIADFSVEFPHDLVWGEEGANSDVSRELSDRYWAWRVDSIDRTGSLVRNHQRFHSGEVSDFSNCGSTILLSGFEPGAHTPSLSFIHSPFLEGKPTLMAAGNNLELEVEQDDGWTAATELAVREYAPMQLEDVRHFDAASWRNWPPHFRETLDTVLPDRRVDRWMAMGAVALGWTDFSVFPGLSNPHDVAPGAHISNAAGLEVATLSGRPFKEVDWLHGPIDGVIVAASPQLAYEIQQLHAA